MSIKEDREVPADLPRTDFYHWVLIDIGVDKNEIAEGEYCAEVVPRGKGGPLDAAWHASRDQ